MTRRTPIYEVLRFLGAEHSDVLALMRDEGLFEHDELAPEEAEELRVAVLLMRELGVNAAGVDVILRLRRRLLFLQGRTTEALRILLEEREGH